MLAGYAAFWGFTLLGSPPLLTMLAGAPARLRAELAALPLRVASAASAARTTRASARSNSILSTFGLLFVLQGVALVAWTGTDRAYSYLSVPRQHVRRRHQRQPPDRAYRRAGAVRRRICVPALFTATGRAMRAIAAGPHTAPLVGIDVARYSAIAFATGGALAAVAGILLSSFVGINPTIGAAFTMKALIVVVMGGIGHVLGGLVAALRPRPRRDDGAVLHRSRPHHRHQLRHLLDRAAVAAAGAVRRQQRRPPAAAAPARRQMDLRDGRAGCAPGRCRTSPTPTGSRSLVNILTYIALATGWAFFSGADALRVAGGLRLLRHRRLCGRRPRARLLLSGSLCWRRVGISIVLSAFVGLATLRLSGMYFVIFTFGLASLVSAIVNWWEFNIAQKAGWHLFLSITHDAHLLPAARPVRRHHRPVDVARPQPHGLRAQDARRRRDRGAPGRHQHRRAQDRHLRRQLRGDDARRRHPRPALDLHGRHRRLQSQHLVPDRHHGAARRRHLGVGADARRGAAGADLGLPLGRRCPTTSAWCWAWCCSASCSSSPTA